MSTLAEKVPATAQVGPGPRRATTLVAVAAALLVVAVLVAGQLGRGRALADLSNQATAALPLATAALTGVIEKQRLVPLTLARDPEVIALLAAPAPAEEARLDAKLRDIAAEAGSAVIYLIDNGGLTVAASNAGQPASFGGSDYGFRDYFTKAMADGTAAQYALGTVSRRPGLYLSRRVEAARGPLGVVVVKVELDDLEARWRESGFIVYVTDALGVLLATSVPEWRFAKTEPLADEQAVRAALQFDEGPLASVPVAEAADGLARIEQGGEEALYLRAAGPIGPSAPGWQLTLFTPAEPALTAATRSAQLLAGSLLIATAAVLLRRRYWALAREGALAEMNAELERRVTRRTEELNRSNAALTAEIVEREAAETRVRRLREDLAQANRLSILGQIAAGVAHEINQPVAAIRTYAESGAQLLAAGDAVEARGNLGAIVKITGRIGTITDMLRGFARRGTGTVGPVAVEEAIDGALALLAGRIQDAGAVIDRGERLPDALVVAGRIRLEQILVNLLQNALDAMRGRADPKIAIRVTVGVDDVAISVRDNGPGVGAEVRETLFMPFTTTKDTGLGLGLVISSDIAREFGGDLRLDPEDGSGACFTLSLRSAS